MAMLPTMVEQDRIRAGWSVGQATWRLGVSIREYRELEAGRSLAELGTYDRICEQYGWPQTFVAAVPVRSANAFVRDRKRTR